MSVLPDSLSRELSREFARLNAEIQRLTSELAEAKKTLEPGNECYLRLHVETKNLRSENASLQQRALTPYEAVCILEEANWIETLNSKLRAIADHYEEKGGESTMTNEEQFERDCLESEERDWKNSPEDVFTDKPEDVNWLLNHADALAKTVEEGAQYIGDEEIILFVSGFRRQQEIISSLTAKLEKRNRELEAEYLSHDPLRLEIQRLTVQLDSFKTQPTSEEWEKAVGAFRTAILKVSQKAGRAEVAEVAAARSSLDSIRDRYETRITELEWATRILEEFADALSEGGN